MQNSSSRSFARGHILMLSILICWWLTLGIGYQAFFYQGSLFTVSIIGTFSNYVNVFLGIVISLLPLGILFFEAKKFWLLVLLVSYVFFCLTDMNRLTPYFISYLGIFTAFSFNQKDRKNLEKTLLIVAAGIYIFSGIHKFNNQFAGTILKYIWFYSLPIEPSANVGYVVAALETALGIALLSKKTRKVACIFLIGMHLILLWKLSPFKLNWNLIVWPWNIAMMTVIWFVYRSEARITSIFKQRSWIHLTLGVFFFVIPFLTVFKAAPENMGFKLYSGTSLSAYLKIDKKLEEFKGRDYDVDDNTTTINLQSTAINSQHLAINPEPWIFKRIAENYSRYYKVNTQIVSKPKINEKD